MPGETSWIVRNRRDAAQLAEFQAWLQAQRPVLDPLMVLVDDHEDVSLLWADKHTPT